MSTMRAKWRTMPVSGRHLQDLLILGFKTPARGATKMTDSYGHRAEFGTQEHLSFYVDESFQTALFLRNEERQHATENIRRSYSIAPKDRQHLYPIMFRSFKQRSLCVDKQHLKN